LEVWSFEVWGFGLGVLVSGVRYSAWGVAVNMPVIRNVLTFWV
jgi:hypothetical protein